MSMNQNNFEKIVDAASKKSGANKDAIKQAVQSGNFNSVLNNLKPNEIKKIKGLMNDKAALEQILNSQQAQQLLKNLTEGK